MHTYNVAFKALLTVTAIAVVLLTAVQIYLPPSFMPESRDMKAFSAARAYTYLTNTHAQPHPLGSIAHDSVVHFIRNSLTSMNIESTVQQTTGILIDSAGYFAPNELWAANIQNIIAKIPGTNPKGTILLMAHYDAMPTTCGASDGGAGTAALLETARALTSGPPLDNDVVLFFSDADVNGCIGAETFKKHHPLAQQYDVVLKVEGMGNGGGVMLIYASADNYRLVRDFVRTAPQPQTMLFANDLLNKMQMASSPDVSIMLKGRKAAGMGFAYADKPHVYHTMIDCPENLKTGVLQQYGTNLLAFTRFLGHQSLTSYREAQPEAIAFSLSRKTAIVYPSTFALPLALILTVLLVFLTRYEANRHHIRLKSILYNVLIFPVWWAGSMVLCTAIMYGIKKVHPNYAVFLQGIYGFNWYLPMMVALSTLLFFAVFRRRLHTEHGHAVWVSAMWWGAIMALFTAWAAPSASYFFAMPLLAAVLLYNGIFYATTMSAFTGLTFYTIWVILVGAPAAIFMYLFSARYYAMGDFPYAFLSVALFSWLIGMLAPFWQALTTASDGTVSRHVFGIAGAISILFAGTGWLNAGFSNRQPYPNYVAYDYDADSQKAFWFALGPKTDAFTKQWLGESPEKAQYEIFPGYFPDWVYNGWKAAAPILEVMPPQCMVSEDTAAMGNLRKINLKIATNHQWNAIRLTLKANTLGSEYQLNRQVFSTKGIADSLSHRLRVLLFNPEDTVRITLTIGKNDPLDYYVETYRNGLPDIPDKPMHPRNLAMMPGMAEFTDPTVWHKHFHFSQTRHEK